MQHMVEKRIKIIYGITKSDWGGAQRYVYDLATALPKEKYDVAVILGSTGGLSQKLQSAGIRIAQLENLSRDVKIWTDFLAFFKLIKILHQEKPDVIHLNSSKMGMLGAVAGRILRVPKIIFTGHGWAFNEDRSAVQKKMIHLLHNLTVALSDVTIAVSAKTKEQIARHGTNSDKIMVIKNGVEKIDFLDKNLARQKITEKISTEMENSIDGRIWLGTISELHKNKGLKYMIEAMHRLKITVDDPATLPILVVIGEGEKRTKLQERINRYGLQDDIFLIGRLENASRYLKAFDIFTLTSITEALPYVVLEAGSAGLPIVASAVGGIPEIIDDMTSGILVRPKEPEEIEKAVRYLLNNPDKMALFGQRLKEKIERDFNVDKMLEKTLALYQ
jgi:glycosyltransferase involved in cell wall biosynthesis